MNPCPPARTPEKFLIQPRTGPQKYELLKSSVQPIDLVQHRCFWAAPMPSVPLCFLRGLFFRCLSDAKYASFRSLTRRNALACPPLSGCVRKYNSRINFCRTTRGSHSHCRRISVTSSSVGCWFLKLFRNQALSPDGEPVWSVWSSRENPPHGEPVSARDRTVMTRSGRDPARRWAAAVRPIHCFVRQSIRCCVELAVGVLDANVDAQAPQLAQ